MEHTKGPWKATQINSIVNAKAGKQIAVVVKGGRSMKELTANAQRIVHCVNSHDELVTENTVLKEAVHTLRPSAECYQRVCESLGIEKDILGYVNKLVTALESVDRYNKAAKEGRVSNDEGHDYWEVVMDEVEQVLAEVKK